MSVFRWNGKLTYCIDQAEVVCQFIASSPAANSTGWSCLPIPFMREKVTLERRNGRRTINCPTKYSYIYRTIMYNTQSASHVTFQFRVARGWSCLPIRFMREKVTLERRNGRRTIKCPTKYSYIYRTIMYNTQSASHVTFQFRVARGWSCLPIRFMREKVTLERRNGRRTIKCPTKYSYIYRTIMYNTQSASHVTFQFRVARGLLSNCVTL